MASSQTRARWSKHHQRGGRWSQQTKTTTPLTPALPLGSLLESVRVSDLTEASRRYTQTAFIQNCELAASYNWMKSVEPSIVIPGKPPRWMPLTEPTQLSEDAGTYYRDRNAAHLPKHPMEAAAVACLSADPTMPSKVDVVACSSSLGNLLRFVRGEGKTFRILVEVVHGSVFLIRRENSPREIIPDVYGYGHSFPDAYTTWEADVKASLSHQRILRYTFGGLDFLVRFEADGYMPRPGVTTSPHHTDSVPSIDHLGNLLLSPGVSNSGPVTGSRLTVAAGGSVVEQDNVFDIKTRSQRKIDEDVVGKELPRLWVTQIPTFVLGYHDKGTFNKIQVMDVRKDVKRWEEQHRQELSSLTALIHKIVELVFAQKDGKVELCVSGSGSMEVRSQLPDAGDALSVETRKRWLAGKQSTERDSDLSCHNDSSLEVQSDGDVYEDLIWDPESVKRKETREPDYTACSGEHCGYCGKCN